MSCVFRLSRYCLSLFILFVNHSVLCQQRSDLGTSEPEAIIELKRYEHALEEAYKAHAKSLHDEEINVAHALADSKFRGTKSEVDVLTRQIGEIKLERRQVGENYTQPSASVGTIYLPRFHPELIGVEDETKFLKPWDESVDEFATVRVFFATNRKRGGDVSQKPSEYFGTRRSQELAFASADITIPLDHARGRLESPLAIWTFKLPWSKVKHVTLINVEPLKLDEFKQAIAQETKRIQAESVFVFIHGYNTPFSECVRRTAQLGYDLTFTRRTGGGILAAFCWPSEGQEALYRVDLNNAEASVHHLEEYLRILSDVFKGKKAYVVAHSMGTRALTWAFKNLVQSSPSFQTSFFREIVLAAPDIDRDIFVNQLAPTVTLPRRKGRRPRITLYSSDRDLALKLSEQYGGRYPRAVQSGSHIVVLDGLDTVDASKVDTSFIGHSYYGDNRSVISDIIQLFWNDLPPERRSELKKAPARSYFEFVK